MHAIASADAMNTRIHNHWISSRPCIPSSQYIPCKPWKPSNPRYPPIPWNTRKLLSMDSIVLMVPASETVRVCRSVCMWIGIIRHGFFWSTLPASWSIVPMSTFAIHVFCDCFVCVVCIILCIAVYRVESVYRVWIQRLHRRTAYKDALQKLHTNIPYEGLHTKIAYKD